MKMRGILKNARDFIYDALFISPQTSRLYSRDEGCREYLWSIERKWQSLLYPTSVLFVMSFGILDDVFLSKLGLGRFLGEFLLFRCFVSVLILSLFVLLRFPSATPSRFLFLLAYLFSIVTSIMIIWMTMKTGGHASPYYAGLYLLIFGVAFLPWSIFRVILNGILIVALYIAGFIVMGVEIEPVALFVKIFFLFSAVFLSAFIALLKWKLLLSEYAKMKNLEKRENIMLHEIGMAEGIQSGIMPALEFSSEKLDMACFRKSMRNVGGDFFELADLRDGKKAIIIADASGHGVSAALLVSMLKIGLNSAFRRYDSPLVILTYINDLIKKSISTYDYITAYMMALDEDRRALISNAAHHIPFLLRDGEATPLSSDVQGMMLGIFNTEDLELEEIAVTLRAGDRIFLYTDGFVQTSHNPEEWFGLERLRYLLLETSSLPVQEARDKIVSRWNAFNGDAAPSDDAMFLLLDIK